ncbi:MAG: hypothetical protein HY720_13620 [Planctomycetes bacterium]|nr:hypothetical protein [Planctomycetota bacterium]
MRTMIALGVVAFLGLFLAAAVEACPASYVHGIGNSNMQSNPNGKASQIADRYMTAKGVDPVTPAGQVIKPYVVGTTVVDDQWGIHSMNKGMDECVQDALNCWHHSQHFGDGAREAGVDPNNPAPLNTLGG